MEFPHFLEQRWTPTPMPTLEVAFVRTQKIGVRHIALLTELYQQTWVHAPSSPARRTCMEGGWHPSSCCVVVQVKEQWFIQARKTPQDVLKQDFRHPSLTVTWQNQQQQQSHPEVAQKPRRKDLDWWRQACKQLQAPVDRNHEGFLATFSHRQHQCQPRLWSLVDCWWDGKQTRGWFVLPCSVICIRKINPQTLTKTQPHGKGGSHSEPTVGAQASPPWLWASKLTESMTEGGGPFSHGRESSLPKSRL